MANSKSIIATPSRTAEIMQTYDIIMKKSLGQNFLVEPNILEKMISVSNITDKTTVIEIGPGIGALTQFLAMNAKEVIAFEIDERFIEILDETLADYSNVKVIHQDILTVDFNESHYENLLNAEELVVVANLPYYITTPIIMHLMDSPLPFERLVMMMQKEVAERMTAAVGTKAYNSLTIAIQNRMDSKISFIVPASVFIPKPKVDSAVLTLIRREQALADVPDYREFEHFVRSSFTQRRKTLWNNLRNNYDKTIDQEQLETAFMVVNIDPQRRAETLTVKDFEKLYLEILKIR